MDLQLNWSDRNSATRLYSRSQRFVTDNDVQNWIKEVDSNANDFVINSVPENHLRKNASSFVSSAITNTRIQESAKSEAQDLLNEWLSEKVISGKNDGEYEAPVETSSTKSRLDIKKEWDHLLGVDRVSPTPELRYEALMVPHKDPYDILKEDNDSTVEGILSHMMYKKVINDDFMRDIHSTDSETRKVNPATKMELRHQQVKENRIRRLQEREESLKKRQGKKETEFKARQILKMEEIKKVTEKKREDGALQKEIIRLRKEMENEKIRKKEQKISEKSEKEKINKLAVVEIEKEELEKREQVLASDRARKEKERRIGAKLAEIHLRKTTQNLKLLQNCFTAWYEIIARNRVALGKARAMSDWRLTLRSWNCWRLYVRKEKANRETLDFEMTVKKEQRLKVLADRHYYNHLCSRVFRAWRFFTNSSITVKTLEQETSARLLKMSDFLKRASNLSEAKSETNKTSKKFPPKNDTDSFRQGSASKGAKASVSVNEENKQLDEFFETGPLSTPKLPAGTEELKPKSLENNKTAHLPKTPMQVTPKHVNLSKEEIANLTAKADQTTTKVQTASEKSRPKINSFEHRHSNQQQILKNQQKQIQEQHRLIEELTYLQKQQMLQQELVNQQLLKQNVDKTDNRPISQPVNIDSRQSSRTQSGTDLAVPKITTHLNKLQTELMEQNDFKNPPLKEQNCNLEDKLSDRSESLYQNSTKTSQTGRSGFSGSKHDKFLNALEERASERKRMKNEREEKRRQQEKERLQKLEEEAKEREKQAFLEKQARIQAHKEKKLQEKQREIEREKERQALQTLIEKADQHRTYTIMKYRGWKPWRILVQRLHDRSELARRHYSQVILRKYIRVLSNFARDEIEKKNLMADRLFEHNLLRRCIKNWIRIKDYMSILERRADGFYRTNTLKNVLLAWSDYSEKEKIADRRKERLASEHNTKRIVARTFVAWKNYPVYVEQEKARLKRLEEMRKKVASILPDFQPSDPILSKSFES